eukprot:gene14108-5099_t
MSESSCSSPVPSATPSEADSIYIQEGQMINFLRSDKGLEMFAKAQELTKEELIYFLECKRNGEDYYQNNHASPSENDEKHDDDNPKRRRHRGTYSKSTCLQVIEFVKKGYSARAAAKKFGIPKSTVHNWLHEDVTTRPEKGHRKKDFHHDKLDDVEHDYHKNMTDLGHSLAQTTIKDEPKFNILRDQPKVEQKSSSINSPSPVSSQSTLVQLLTSNSKPTAVKTEPDDNIALSDADMEYIDFGVIDEILHPDDWIEHERWYKEQYHNHYNRDSPNGKQRKTYGTYSNEHRMKATEFVKSGKTLSAASKQFNIPKSTIHTWLNEGNVPCELPPELESVVFEEIEQSKGHSSPLLAVIKRKAEEVAVPHMEKFKPSFAWCRDFMKRHYMDRSDEIDAKKLCLESMKKRGSINDLVSVLGLHSSNVEGPVIRTSNSTSPVSPSMKSLLFHGGIEPNRNDSSERIS